jgi:hypothetical protein
MYYNIFVILRGAFIKAERMNIDPWPDLDNASEGIIWKDVIFFIFIFVLADKFFFDNGGRYERKKI